MPADEEVLIVQANSCFERQTLHCRSKHTLARRRRRVLQATGGLTIKVNAALISSVNNGHSDETATQLAATARDRHIR